MELDMPYFMYDKSWYYYDPEESCYKLTEEAPASAVKSYEKFYKALNEVDE